MRTIRAATEADAPALAWLIGQSFARQAQVLGIARAAYPDYVAFETVEGVRQRIASPAHVALLHEVRNSPFAGGYIVRRYGSPPELEALQLELRYTNYLDCDRIDERRPRLDPDRLAAAQARLLPALREAIAPFTAGT